MKLFFLSCSVLCIHLALIGGFRVAAHPNQTPEAQTPFQTRQILKAPPTPIPATPISHHLAPRPVLSTKQQTKIATLATSIPQPTQVAPPLETIRPLKTNADAEGDSTVKTDKTTSATTPNMNNGVNGNTTTSNEIRLPSSQAEYINNPQPPYPALSLRMHETGKVVLRVLIGKDGQALRAEVFQSSGYHRLDQSAQKAVLSWRYVPGKVNGQAQDMWFDVPISFKLSN